MQFGSVFRKLSIPIFGGKRLGGEGEMRILGNGRKGNEMLRVADI